MFCCWIALTFMHWDLLEMLSTEGDWIGCNLSGSIYFYTVKVLLRIYIINEFLTTTATCNIQICGSEELVLQGCVWIARCGMLACLMKGCTLASCWISRARLLDPPPPGCYWKCSNNIVCCSCEWFLSNFVFLLMINRTMLKKSRNVPENAAIKLILLQKMFTSDLDSQ